VTLEIAQVFEYDTSMQLGDCSTAGIGQRAPLDAALSEAQQALSSMIELLEGGGLERLSPEEKLTWWHRFETFRTEAASRVRAAAAVGSRRSLLGERLEPRLPQLAALQREGVVSTEKVAIVERAMHKLSRPDLDPVAVQAAERLLSERHCWDRRICTGSPCRWWMLPIQTAQHLSMMPCSKTAGISNSNCVGMACGGCRANSHPPLARN
jgi:non-ribosomal peptide synthetase component F